MQNTHIHSYMNEQRKAYMKVSPMADWELWEIFFAFHILLYNLNFIKENMYYFSNNLN